MEISQKKSAIYPKNFFDSEEEEDENENEEDQDEGKPEAVLDTAGRLPAMIIGNEQLGGSFNNGRVITLKTEGDQLLFAEPSSTAPKKTQP